MTTIYLRPMLCLTFLWFAAASCVGDVTLVQDGVPRATIVTPRQPVAEENFAAQRLQHYIARMSGAELPIVAEDTASDGPAVYVGRTHASAAVQQRLEARRPPAEASLVSVAGETVHIVGADPIGVLHGAYFLLEDLGCRWWFPAPWGTVVPSRRTIALPEGEQYRAPDFIIRTGLPTVGTAEDGDVDWTPHEWGRGNHMGGWRWWGSGHSYQYLVDFGEFANHPEWFAYYDGARHPTQLCTTHPEVRRRALETVLRVLQQPGAPELICVSPNDGHGFCECDTCKRLIPPDGGSIDRIVEFANFIADNIRDKYPGHYVTYYCDYHSVGTPTLVTPAKNTVFWITQWAQDHFHGVGPDTPMGKSIERWSRFGNPIYVYTYYGSYGSWTFWPQVHAIRNDIPYYKQHGVIGIYSETHQHWGTQHLNFIVFPRLAWGAGADVDRIIADFCDSFYGPAAEPMRQVYDLLETTAQHGPAQYQLHSDIIAIFSPPILAQLRELIAQAQQAVAEAEPVYRQRMEFVAAGFRHADLYLTAQHLKPKYARTKDPAIRQAIIDKIAQALAIVTAPAYANRLTENWLSEATMKRELDLLRGSTTYGPGRFSYSDYLVRGGNTAMDAVRKTGLLDGVWGLDMDAGTSGELVYDFRATAGTFASAQLNTLIFGSKLIGARLEVADSLEGPWTVVAAHEEPTGDNPSGLPLPVDLTDHVRGKQRFFLRLALTNRTGGYTCALCNIGVQGEVVE